MEDFEFDTLTGAMMKAYVNNKYYLKALNLYDDCKNFNIKLSDICHTFATKSSTKMNDFGRENEVIYGIECKEYSDIKLIHRY